jgi:hypothetical protein
VLIIASGKCSNFSEFEPFVVRLDFDMMLYSRDDAFDVEQWRDSLESAKSTVDKLMLDSLLAILAEIGTMPKKPQSTAPRQRRRRKEAPRLSG